MTISEISKAAVLKNIKFDLCLRRILRISVEYCSIAQKIKKKLFYIEYTVNKMYTNVSFHSQSSLFHFIFFTDCYIWRI